jgi:tetratricopeptide (TPR) repeat protein
MAKKIAKGSVTGAAAGKARGKVDVKLTPAKKVVPASPQASPEAPPVAPKGTPSAEQVAAWQALPQDQKTALREREASRLFDLAVKHHQKSELKEAVNVYGKSLLLNPKIADVYNNMGVALRVLGKLEAAVACYRRCLVLRPNNSGVYSNMGNALRELGRLQLAVAAHQQAIKLSPESPEAYYNLGLVLRDLGQVTQALAAFERTLGYNPDHADCRWDRALTLLLRGDFLPGFEQYDWRWKLDRSPPRGFSEPEWDGADLKGKTLLIHQEQGFGDMIQFARYIPMVKERGGTVVVEVQPELSRLFSTLPGVDKVINRGAPLPKFDLFIPMMSLAKVFATSKDNVPADIPYLTPPDMLAVQLPVSLERQRKIGIVWAGKPTHQNDKNRSCTFSNFIELLGMPGASIYSLQKGPREADIAENGCEALVLNLGGRLNDFADTASVIQQLDMVITVDTSVAHLAGALGKPVWVLVPYAPDWRWMTETDSSPWYPTMRLFRQKKHGDWESVFVDVRRALRDELDLSPSQAK